MKIDQTYLSLACIVLVTGFYLRISWLRSELCDIIKELNETLELSQKQLGEVTAHATALVARHEKLKNLPSHPKGPFQITKRRSPTVNSDRDVYLREKEKETKV